MNGNLPFIMRVSNARCTANESFCDLIYLPFTTKDCFARVDCDKASVPTYPVIFMYPSSYESLRRLSMTLEP